MSDVGIAMREQTLSERERQTVALAKLRLPDKEIAERMSISPATVRRHLFSAYGKLGITSRKQLWAEADRGSREMAELAAVAERHWQRPEGANDALFVRLIVCGQAQRRATT